MDLVIIFDGKDYWLLTTRGMIQLMHPDAINSMKAAGIPMATVDSGTIANMKAVLTRAP